MIKSISQLLNFPPFSVRGCKGITTISKQSFTTQNEWNHRCFEKIFSPLIFASCCRHAFVNFIFTVCSPNNTKKSENGHKSWGKRAYTQQRHGFYAWLYPFFSPWPFPLLRIYSLFLSLFIIPYFFVAALFHRSYIILNVSFTSNRRWELMVGNY